MSTRKARDAGIRPHDPDREEPPMSENTETATVDQILVVDQDNRSGILVLAGDRIPETHAHLPRVDRDWQPLTP